MYSSKLFDGKLQTVELPAVNGSWHLKDRFFQTSADVHFAVVFVDQAINMQNFRYLFYFHLELNRVFSK